jgi:hypothetical protein
MTLFSWLNFASFSRYCILCLHLSLIISKHCSCFVKRITSQYRLKFGGETRCDASHQPTEVMDGPWDQSARSAAPVFDRGGWSNHVMAPHRLFNWVTNRVRINCTDRWYKLASGKALLWTVEGTVNSYLRGFGEGFLSYKFPVRCCISIRFVIRMLQIDKTLQIMICKSKITLSYLWLVKAHFRMSNPNTWFHPFLSRLGRID